MRVQWFHALWCTVVPCRALAGESRGMGKLQKGLGGAYNRKTILINFWCSPFAIKIEKGAGFPILFERKSLTDLGDWKTGYRFPNRLHFQL